MSGADFAERLDDLEARLRELSLNAASAADLDVIWIIVSAVLVFFMQVGFAMLEVGSVSPKNTKAVLLKNIGDASLGALCWWLVGFAVAYGEDSNGFIGTDMFALKGGRFMTPGAKEAEWMFDWAFAATSVTIVSGAIAERVKIAAYVMYAIFLTSFIYPLVVHWAWHTDGWASPYREAGAGASLLAGCGAVDFAGSGVVHMVGGTAALVAAIAVRPRRGRFRRDGSVCRLPQQSPALQTLGTLILWVGWYAFNAGSSVTVSAGRSVVAARAVVSTTIGPSAGVLVMVVSLKIMEKKFDTRGVNNGILSGLVAITSGAPLVNAEGAFVIGVISAGVYYCSAHLMLRFKIDDVVDAAPVHLFCGMWGMVATGLFATREGWALTYQERGGDRADECCGLFYGCGFSLLFANLALMSAIGLWVGGTSIILFYTIDATVGLRVPAGEEETGLDRTRHSFATTGSGGGQNKPGGMDAVRRAFTKAHWGIDDSSYYATGSSRSQQSSRAGSLSSSKHGDLSAAGVSNGKHVPAWGGGLAYDLRAEQRAAGTATAQVFGRQSRGRGEAHGGGGSAQHRLPTAPSAAKAAAGGGPAMAAEAVTPSVGRGAPYGFGGTGYLPGGGVGGDGGMGARNGGRWRGAGGALNGKLGMPAAAAVGAAAAAAAAAAATSSPPTALGKPKWRRKLRGGTGASGRGMKKRIRWRIHTRCDIMAGTSFNTGTGGWMHSLGFGFYMYSRVVFARAW